MRCFLLDGFSFDTSTLQSCCVILLQQSWSNHGVTWSVTCCLYLNNVDLSWFLKQKWNSNAFVCFSCLRHSVLCSWCSTLTRYISKPLLLDGYKFDLRLYVLVSGCDPLRIFLHRWSSQRWAAVWGKKLPCTRQESSCSPTRLYILHESGLEVWKILWSSYLEMCKTIEPKLNSSHDDVLPCCSCTHAVTTRMQSGQMIELVSSDRPS